MNQKELFDEPEDEFGISELAKRFEEIAGSDKDFPIDFDEAWMWVGYSQKVRGVESLRKNFTEGIDFQLSVERKVGTRDNGSGAATINIYRITVDCFKSFCMLAQTQQGKKVREYYLEVEKRFIEAKSKFKVPKTLSEALRLAADLADIVQAQNDRLSIIEPKAKVYDQISNAIGLKTIQEVAKIIGIGPNELFRKLEDMKAIYRTNGALVPNERYGKRGLAYFDAREEPYQVGGQSRVYTRIFVTPKGEIWLAQQFGKVS